MNMNINIELEELCDEDRTFIKDVLNLSPEKQALVKGIVIGLQMQQNGEVQEV